MSKTLKIVLCAVLIVALVAGSVLTLVFCGKKDDNNNQAKYDSENDVVRFAIEGQDGVFNPFFSTTAYDSEIAGMTQIGMLTTSGKDATISYGENEACVTLYMKETRLDAAGNVIPDGDTTTTVDRTRYSFVIKNGIKFSDGTPLTIKDVLFNLYVYLDPAYTGNATIYSTAIVGLTAYRTQGEVDDESDFNTGFEVEAINRRQAIYDYCQYFIRLNNPSAAGGAGSKPADGSAALARILSDIEIVKELYREELNTDYQSAIESLEDTKKEYTVDTAWQLFLYYEGIASVKTDTVTGNPVKENGRYVIDYEQYNTIVNNYVDAHYTEFMTDGKTEAEAREAAARQSAMDMVWANYIEYSAGEGEETILNYQGLQRILFGSASSAEIITRFTAEAKSDYFKEMRESGELAVKNISGITTERVTTFDGKDLGEAHDVLHITINGVDPKAIWNFAFTVAPMHYYSNEEQINLFDGVSHFGVEFSSTTFMNNAVKNTDKLGVPVGAGPYRASRLGGMSSDSVYPTKNEFCSNNIIYFERNNYFETVGSGLHNAKIKYIRYQVVNSAQMVAALTTDTVDVGSPSGTQANITEIGKASHLSTKEILTNGYGYVGINARLVPDYNVRKAIMQAMDTSLILNYYPAGSCQRIFWPMSTTSWAYPNDGAVNPYYPLNTAEEILNNLKDAGYYQRFDSDGTLIGLGKEDDSGTWKRLEYTFTIPGTSNDHPANVMFEVAAQTLNSIGFKISVKTDNWALKKLATGDLAVWAAAWSSTVDPDMYQVYHKESNAGSTLSWGYDAFKADRDTYAYENGIVDRLSEVIDRARSTTDRDLRTRDYAEAMDLVMQLAVEMPTYQRKDLTVFNSSKIDRATLTPDSELGPNNSLFARIWEMDFVK